MHDKVRHVFLRREGEDVLEVTNQPGLFVSLSAPPPRPGEMPVEHPFANAYFLRPEYEGELADLLRETHSFDEFLAAAGERGYEVEDRTD